MRRVGVGTACRRFADERQLIEELLDERVSRMVQLGEHALAARDTWDGLAGFLEQTAELQIANRGLKEINFGSDHGTALADRARARVGPLVEQLLDRRAGQRCRPPDLVSTDAPLIQLIAGAAAELTSPDAPRGLAPLPRVRDRRPAHTRAATATASPAAPRRFLLRPWVGVAAPGRLARWWGQRRPRLETVKAGSWSRSSGLPGRGVGV